GARGSGRTGVPNRPLSSRRAFSSGRSRGPGSAINPRRALGPGGSCRPRYAINACRPLWPAVCFGPPVGSGYVVAGRVLRLDGTRVIDVFSRTQSRNHRVVVAWSVVGLTRTSEKLGLERDHQVSADQPDHVGPIRENRTPVAAQEQAIFQGLKAD